MQTAQLEKNGTMSDSRPSIIHTGVKDITRLAEYIQWNGHKYFMDTWPEDSANLIQGTEGIFFKPNLKRGEALKLFVGDLHRSFDLEYTGLKENLGLKTFRYKFPLSIFRGAFSLPENAAYGSWCPDGMFYIGPVKDPELPLYLSKPHFLDGDWTLLSGVEGLSPSRSNHESHMDVEPNIGVNIDSSIKLQLNVRVNVSSNFT